MKEKPKRSTKPRSQVDPEVSELLAGLDGLFARSQEIQMRYETACQAFQRPGGDERIEAYRQAVADQCTMEAEVKGLVPRLRSVLAAAVFRRPSLKSLWGEFNRTLEALLEPEPELGEVLTDLRSVLLAVQAADGGQPVPVAPVRELTPAELAGRIGQSEGTLAKWRGQAKGPSWIKVGRTVLYPVQQVEDWLESLREVSSGNSSKMREVALSVPPRGSGLLGKHRFGRHATKQEKSPAGHGGATAGDSGTGPAPEGETVH